MTELEPVKFDRGDYVRKKSGAFWEGDVVGDYNTDQTSDGVCVRLFGWADGPVQIYPAAALEHVDKARGRLSTAYRRGREDMREEAAKMASPNHGDGIFDQYEHGRRDAAAAIRKLEA